MTSSSPRIRLPLPGALRRPRVVPLDGDLVVAGALPDAGPFPVLVAPATRGVDLAQWAETSRPWIDQQLDQHGALLFRGFSIDTPAAFERATVAAVGCSLLPYEERSSPRREVRGNVYSSTIHPADQHIFLHNENSYQNSFPARLAFACIQPATRGGSTPIAHCGRVLRRLPAEIRARFLERQWMCVRNYREGLGLSWQEVFQTEVPAEVEARCRRDGLEVAWHGPGRLTTRAVRPAVACHPRTGESSWFNHAAFFHVSTLEPALRELLARQMREDELPANTYYGDGGAIEPETLDAIREAYRAETVQFTWERGDFLLLDNLLVAHGRTPFEGDRTVLVAMARALTRADVALTLEPGPVTA